MHVSAGLHRGRACMCLPAIALRCESTCRRGRTYGGGAQEDAHAAVCGGPIWIQRRSSCGSDLHLEAVCVKENVPLEPAIAWHGMAWHGMAWHGMAWHGMAWRGVACHGMAWHGMLCDAMLCYARLCYAMLCNAMLCSNLPCAMEGAVGQERIVGKE
jgi:hypothetical protein